MTTAAPFNRTTAAPPAPSAADAAARGHPAASEGELVIFFVFLCLTLGLVVETCLEKIRCRFPPAAAQFLLGILLGLATLIHSGDVGGEGTLLKQGALSVGSVSPRVLLFFFLPPMLFESAFSLNGHIFRRSLVQILSLAIPGVLFNAFLTAAAIFLIYPTWNWAGALLFGFTVSATDPTTVVAILRKTGGHPALRTLLEGESLVNDGTAVACLFIVLSIFHDGDDSSNSAGEALATFLRMAFGGSLFGLTIGCLSVCWTGRVYNQPLIEISIPLAGSYTAYFIAEALLGVSGVFSVVVFGLHYGAAGKTHISPKVEEYLTEFWGMLAYIANTIVFILSGAIMARRFLILSFGMGDFCWLFVLYIVIILVRAAMVASFSPFLMASGYGLSFRKAVVLAWGGLRGAVSLCMALFVVLDPVLSETSPHMADLIFFHVSGIVMLTMCVNASTMGYLVRKIGFDFVAPSRELLFGEAMKEIERAGDLEERNLKTDSLYGCARWDDVRSFKWSRETNIPIKKMTNASAEIGASKTRLQRGNRASFSVSTKDEATRRFLVAVKMSYWQQFRDGLVGRVAVRELMEAVDQALDQLDCQSCAQNYEDKKVVPKKEETGQDDDGVLAWADTMYLALQGVRVSSWTKVLLDLPFTRPFAIRYQYSRLRYHHDVVKAFLVARQEAIDHLRATFFASRQRYLESGVKSEADENISNDQILDRTVVADEHPENDVNDSLERTRSEDKWHYVSAFELIIARAQLDIVKARASLFRIQSALPEIAATIVTNHAARAVLNAQLRRVIELKEDGILDGLEEARATAVIEKQKKRLLLHPRRFELPSARALLSEITWISSLDAGTQRNLQTVMVERFFPAGGTIIQEGSCGADVFILARGTAKVTKYCSSDGDRERIEIGLLGVGSVAGEMACILGGRRSATVTAVGACLCFQIPGLAMAELVKSSTVLHQRLWVVCARRMAECAIIEREERLGRDVRRRALRKQLQDWNIIVPCFANASSGANTSIGHGRGEGKTFEAHADIFLAHGTFARLVDNNSDGLISPDAGRAAPIRGKSFKVLLGPKERSANHYEEIISAPAFVQRLGHETTIRGRVISPENGGAVIISPSQERLASAFNSGNLRPSQSRAGQHQAVEATRAKKTEEQRRMKDHDIIYGPINRSKYTVVEVGG